MVLFLCVLKIGQSCLTLLIDYGNISGLTGGMVQMPIIPEIPMNEFGQRKSFECIKKMVNLNERNLFVNNCFTTVCVIFVANTHKGGLQEKKSWKKN